MNSVKKSLNIKTLYLKPTMFNIDEVVVKANKLTNQIFASIDN